MKVYEEIDLKDFEFWGGAKAVAALITEEEMIMIDDYITDLQSCEEEGIWSRTSVNDFFWFDNDLIAEILGYENFDEMWEDRKNENR